MIGNNVLKTCTTTLPIKDACTMKKRNLFFVISLLFSCALQADDAGLLERMARLEEKIEESNRLARESNTIAKEQERFLGYLKRVGDVVQVVATKVLLPKFQEGLNSLEGKEKEEAQQIFDVLALLLGVQAQEVVGTNPSEDTKISDKKEEKKKEEGPSIDEKIKATLPDTN